MTYPDGRVVYYNYGSGIDDMLSRVTDIAASATPDGAETYAAYSYLGTDTIVQVDHPAVAGDLVLSFGSNGTYSGWDRFGRVVQQEWTVDGSLVDGYAYTYDRNSNRLTRTNLAKTDGSLDESYTYDGLDRLTGWARGDSAHTQSWGLDSLGNPASTTTDSVTVDRGTNAANEITGITDPTTRDPTQPAPAYDAAGNMVFDGTQHYTYDAWNRMVSASTDHVVDGEHVADKLIARYSYDGRNYRIAESVARYDGDPGVITGYDRTDDYYNENWCCGPAILVRVTFGR